MYNNSCSLSHVTNANLDIKPISLGSSNIFCTSTNCGLTRYNELLKARVDVDFVIRLERNNDSHTISNKIFDFSDMTIRQLIYDGYRDPTTDESNFE
jgi:hypothetical protein